MKKIMLMAFVIGLSACTDPSEATRVLSNEGYTEIQMTGYNMFACSEDDFYHTGFSAKNREGLVVTGTVCSGMLFKGSTIRY